MVNRRRGWSGWFVLGLAGPSVVLGCHNQTACEPPSAGLGQVVAWRKSEAYQAQIDKNQADVAHIACRAETTIRTMKAYIRESEDANCDGKGIVCLQTGTMDPRLHPPGVNVHTAEGEFRVLGLGQGMELEDCGQAAMQACNLGIDQYYAKARAVRPPSLECRLAEDETRCEAGFAKPRAIAASTAEPEPSFPGVERDPAVWVARLAEPERRPVAVRALVHFFSDAVTKADGKVSDPAVRSLLDQIVEPMARLYVESKLERSTRHLVIKFLADARDARGGPAFLHALRSFAKDGSTDEYDVAFAAQGIDATKFEEGAPALGEAFAKLEAGSAQGSAPKNVSDAMKHVKSAAWKSMLLEKIARPIERPSRSAEASKVAAYQTELYWQQTAADLLGGYGDASAVKPLVKVLMDKEKGEIGASALRSLTRLGAVAIAPLSEVVTGRDAEIAEWAKSQTAPGADGKIHVRAAAVAIGAIGRSDGRPALLQALKAADNDLNRAVVARELTALPSSPEAEKALQGAYEKVPATASIWPSMFAARPALLTAAARWHDAELVPWLLTQANLAKGNEEIQNAALGSAISLMKSAQVAKVKPVVEKLGDAHTKAAFQAAAQVVGSCSEDVDCYLAKLKNASADDANEALVGQKAAHMVGMLGDSRAGMEIVRQLPQIRHAEVRVAAVMALDHAVQIDAATVADGLQKSLDAEAKDGPGPLASTPAEQVSYRLRAR